MRSEWIKMPTSTSKISETADAPLPSGPFVLDFLYHDSRRIGSFLSQFEGDGHLQQMTTSKEGSKGKKENSNQEVKGNVGVASGTAKGGTETAFEMTEGYAKVFDPYWTNARAFLDHLSEHDMLQRNLGEAELGQFVFVKGWLSVLDLVMFKEVWKLPSFQKKMKAGAVGNAKTSTMTAAQKAVFHENKENADLFVDLMQVMPHSVHASLLSSEEDAARMFWCTLRDEYLVMPASDIALAHGTMLPGEWSMVGILTALPDHLSPNFEYEPSEDLEPGIMQSVVGNVAQSIAPIVKTFLGRPAAAYALTPLLVFREVA